VYATAETTLPAETLPTGFADGADVTGVTVAEVYTPTYFYWLLTAKLALVEKLSNRMTDFYAASRVEEDRVPPQHISAGLVVAVLFSDGLWYRGRVLQGHPNDQV